MFMLPARLHTNLPSNDDKQLSLSNIVLAEQWLNETESEGGLNKVPSYLSASVLPVSTVSICY
jgi:hypothetical protein